MPDIFGIYIDKSKLTRAWEEYYSKMGLSRNKIIDKVHYRKLKGKMPTK